MIHDESGLSDGGGVLPVHESMMAGLHPVPPPGRWRPWVGRRIGPYTLGRWIGTGGMGAVFEVSGSTAPCIAALKLVPPEQATADSVSRLLREARILRMLSHPGIVSCLDSGVHRPMGPEGPAVPYLVMERVPGAMDVVSFCEHYALATTDMLEMVASACDALQHAHARGVVHRDLKPSHLLVDDLGRPRLIDFGDARGEDIDDRLDGTRPRVGETVCSLASMAPEQCDGSSLHADARSDVYAMGAILYRLVTGRPAHDLEGARTPGEAARRRRRPPVRPSRMNHALRGDLEDVIMRAMEQDPARRHGTAEALAQDLRRCRSTRRTVTAPMSRGGWLRPLQRLAGRWLPRAAMEPVHDPLGSRC